MRKILLLWVILLVGFSAPSISYATTTYYAHYQNGAAFTQPVDTLAQAHADAEALVIASNWWGSCITIYSRYAAATNGSISFSGCVGGSATWSIYTEEVTCTAPQVWSNTAHACAAPESPVDPCESRSGESVIGRMPIPSGPAPQSMNFEGCFANISGVTDCWEIVSTGEQVCDYVGTLNGVSAVGGEPAATQGGGSAGAPSGSTTTTAPSTDVSCPTGLTYDPNYNNLGPACVDLGEPGSPSTTETPGTAPTGDTTACPVGYVLDAQGRCSADAPSNGYSCPEGYSLESGKCVAPLPGTTNAAAANYSGETGAIAGAWNSIAGMFNNIASSSGPSHGWSLSLPSMFPVAPECAPWGILNQTIDPCPTANKIRRIAEFCLYVLTIFGLFRILFGPRQISQ